MRRPLYLISAVLLLVLTLFSIYSVNQVKEDLPAPKNDLASYIDTTTTLTFRVNVHFFRPSVTSPLYNGPADIYKNATLADCNTMIALVNQRMAEMQPPDITASSSLTHVYRDSHIRYRLCGIHWHSNDTAFKPSYGFSGWANTRYAIHSDSVINIFFTRDTTRSGVGRGLHGFLVMSDFGWTGVNSWCYTCWNKTFIGTLVHELAHSAGLLGHTDGPHGFGVNVPGNCVYPSGVPADYFVENSHDTCWGNINSKSQGGCASNNIMGYNNDRTYLSPNQIGSFYYGVYAGINTKFVTPASLPKPGK